MKKLLVAGLLFSSSAFADILVVVHPSNNNELTEPQIVDIFLSRNSRFADDTIAVPLNQAKNSAARAKFEGSVLKKTASQMKAHWSKLVFRGKGTPPMEAGNDADVISLISTNPNFIGYIDESAVTDSVKVIARF